VLFRSISVLGVLATIVTVTSTTVQKSSRDSARDGQVRIIASALEKYYRNNGEYPSVAAMTSTNVDALKQKLGITSASVFKLPLASASATTSLAASNPSTTTVVYSANTTDTTKNAQCQTDVNGYCDGFTLAYVKENGGATQTVQSIHATFQAIKTDCDAGDAQSGNTCTHTYAGTYQAGAYTCPSGGTLSGTTCTKTYAASYSPASSGYYCDPPEGTTTQESGYGPGTRTITRSGSTCYSTFTYPASSSGGGGYYSCPNTANGESLSGTTCVGTATYAATASTTYYCSHGVDTYMSQWTCQHPRSGYGTQSGCQNAGYNWQSGACYEYHSTSSSTTYSCPSGGTLSGSTCSTPTSYPAVYTSYPVTYSCPSGATPNGSTCTNSGSFPATYYSYSAYYYCSGSDSLNGTTCTNTYTATQGPGYYTCPSGGVASGSTCTYTYQLQN
jgi:type II secretory pathway pseudopilin PulG